MNVLGVSCFYHDSAAALVRDGRLVAAAAEERFSRRKHDSGYPRHAVDYCLKAGGIQPGDLDLIGFYEKPLRKFHRILTTYVATWPRSYQAFRISIPLWLRDKLRIRRTILKHLRVEKPVLFGEHHLSHAASAFLVSPFHEAAILTIDGVGEWTTTAWGYGRGTDIHLEREIRFPHSLGLFYSALTAYLGFRVNDAEWKVMGLAPYGEPRYVDQFRDLIHVGPDGGFWLDMDYFAYTYDLEIPFSRKYEEHFGQPRRPPGDGLPSEFYRDIARSGQQVTEETVVAMAQALHERYPLDHLCLAGGVGLNSVANWRILQRTPFKDIFIQPAAGDDGGAIGVAFYLYNTVLRNPRRFVMSDAFLGPQFPDEAIRSFLMSRGVPFDELEKDDLLARTARSIADDKVVGWFQGRMEFGPRALGARSILANPMNPAMKKIINAKIKFREPFRPFAPSVLKERVGEYFEIGNIDSPFMLLVPNVRPEKRAQIPAVTHVDGTGRLQTVTRSSHPLFYALIEEFDRLTGCPVVLNTSFNVRGEPIVCTPEDAYNCFMRTGMDVLVMGSFVISVKDDRTLAPDAQIRDYEHLDDG